MPLGFMKRGKRESVAPPPPPLEEIEAEDYSLRVHYDAKSSEGVRIKSRPGATDDLPNMLVGIARGKIDVVEPLPIESGKASPDIERPVEAMAWLNAHHALSPAALHALVVLETLDAVDLAFDTVACGLLSGETDTSGYPLYNSIVGGVASHFDESSGELIVRAVVGWGGKGARGDTDRAASRLLTSLFANIVASQHALGVAPVDRQMPAAGRGGLVCAHCGFSSAHSRAFYCPKCGMRLLRG